MVAEKNGTIRFYDLITHQAILSLECEQTPLMSADWCLKNTLRIGAVAGSDWLIWDITRSRYFLHVGEYFLLKQHVKLCGYFANRTFNCSMYCIIYSLNNKYSSEIIKSLQVISCHTFSCLLLCVKITWYFFLSTWDSISPVFEACLLTCHFKS